MKTITLLVGAAMLALPTGTGDALAAAGQSMTAPHLSVDRWIARIGTRMENLMALDAGLPRLLIRPLMAQVSFKCSETGRPSAVTLVAPSGSPQFDAVALRTVAAMPTLHPLPRDISYSQRYRAVLFYSTDADAPIIGAKAMAIRDHANAWLHRHPTVIVGPTATLTKLD